MSTRSVWPQADAIRRCLSTVPAGSGFERFRLIPTRANGGPPFGCCLKDAHVPIAHAYGLIVLTLSAAKVAALAGVPDTSVFASFELRRTMRE